jgi:hypothetical protein
VWQKFDCKRANHPVHTMKLTRQISTLSGSCVNAAALRTYGETRRSLAHSRFCRCSTRRSACAQTDACRHLAQ